MGWFACRDAARWEWLRVPYNLMVCAAGMVFVLSSPAEAASRFDEIVLFGLGANLLYLLGPICEMYANWIIDIGENRFVPVWLVALVRSPVPTALLFLGGSGFSFVLTLVLAMDLPGPL